MDGRAILTYSEKPNLSTQGRTVNSEVTALNFACILDLRLPEIFGVCSESCSGIACENLHKRLFSPQNGRRKTDTEISAFRRFVRGRFRRPRTPVRGSHRRLPVRRTMDR